VAPQCLLKAGSHAESAKIKHIKDMRGLARKRIKLSLVYYTYLHHHTSAAYNVYLVALMYPSSPVGPSNTTIAA
jgi:hypothetical protein